MIELGRFSSNLALIIPAPQTCTLSHFPLRSNRFRSLSLGSGGTLPEVISHPSLHLEEITEQAN